MDMTGADNLQERGFTSPVLKTHTEPKCLQFSYRMDNMSTDSLEIYRKDGNHRRITLFTTPAKQNYGWITERIDLSHYPKEYWV